MTTTQTKPSYLGLLNAISIAEADAQKYLCAWAATTKDAGVKAVLECVALREGEHGVAFAKRINELGFSVREKEDPTLAGKMEIACSDMSDLEKADALGLGGNRGPDVSDPFDDMFKDHSIDIQTGALLGRYIAEERDSGRMLTDCYAAMKAGSNGSASEQDLQSVNDRLCSIEASIERLDRLMTKGKKAKS